jgi:predicted nucleic acid-binding protein
MARVFWDTNLFIYLLEEHAVFADRVTELRRRMVERGDQLVTSTLTVGEVLTGPALAAEWDLLARYEAYFDSGGVVVVPFDRRAASAYARLRQDRTLQRPDAIQLACAAAAGVSLFLTNDERLSRKVVPGIDFVTSLERAPL